MAGTLTVDTIQSDSSYASTLNVASKINFTSGMQIGGQDATLGGMRNRIINGAMVIDQRNNGTSSNNSTTFNYPVDRSRFTSASSNTATIQRVSDAPTGFTYSAKITCNTAQTLTSSSFHNFGQAIEGFNVGDLAWGTANAKTVTLSFWAKSSLTGTFGGNIASYGGSVTRTYVFQYTISSANTWQKFTITVPGDTGGDWYTVANTNNMGMYVLFAMGEGTNQQAPAANTWNTSDYRFISGNIQIMTTAGATWQITGLQLEVGSSATAFEYRQYGQELALCQRYYQDFRSGGQRSGFPLINTITGDASRVAIYPGLVQMRTAPTITTYATDSTTSGVVTLFSAGTNQSVSSVNQNGGPNIGSGYLQLSGNISNPVYFGATYSSEF
jgi:hypothetical protein